MPSPTGQLSISNHDRDRAGYRYVYPVVSRRAGGVSIGINLNPNNACNWACIYCQVPNLIRGDPPPLDLPLLQAELGAMLDSIQHGDFMQRVPDGQRQLVDIAFSGNGEPTSAPEFAAALAAVIDMRASRGVEHVQLRVISNGSLMLRSPVQQGVRLLGQAGGEVWFKVDAVDTGRMQTINGVAQGRAMTVRRLRQCASLCRTWIQSCMFELDGQLLSVAEEQAYLGLLDEVKDEVAGVLLYGLARPSMQPGADRIRAAPAEWLHELGKKIESRGLIVKVSP